MAFIGVLLFTKRIKVYLKLDDQKVEYVPGHQSLEKLITLLMELMEVYGEETEEHPKNLSE